MKTPFRLLSLFLAATALSGLARAGGGPVTYHVRTNGSDAACSGLLDSADPGTGSTPRDCAFKSPQKAVNTAVGGDTVLIHAGTYTAAGTTVQNVTTILGLSLRADLVSEATRLTIKSAGDGDVVFDGANTLATGIVIWGTSYVTIQGIEIRRFTADQPAASSFTFGASGVQVGSTPTDASSHIVLNDLSISNAALTHATGLFTEIAMWCENCVSNTISSTVVESVNPVGVALGNPASGTVAQNGVFLGNTVRHARDAQAWQGLSALRVDGWTIDGNFFDDGSTANASTDFLVVSNSRQWSIVNNVFFRPPHAAIQILDDADGGDDLEQHDILNNTIECVASPPNPIGIRSQRCTTCEMENNIISKCGSAFRLVDNNNGTEIGYNDLFNNALNVDLTELGSGHVLVGHDLTIDPLFTRASPRPDPFYRLQPLSPAVDVGNDSHCGATADAGGCDMGAYQFGPVAYHVRTNGSDTACSGFTDAADPGIGTTPRACAFKSPQKAVDAAVGGDTVLIHAGTYTAPGTSIQSATTILGLNLRTDLSSEAKRLTIKSAGDGAVVFDGSNILTTGIVIWGTSYVTIQGIEIRRFTADPRAAFPYGASGVNVGSTAGSASSHIVLEDLHIFDSTATHTTGAFAELALWCTNCEDNSVLSSRIESVMPVGVAIGTQATGHVPQNGLFRGNTVKHDRDAQTWQALFGWHADGWTVDGNFFDDGSSADGSTDYLVMSNSRHWSVVNNVFFRPPHAAIQVLDDADGGDDIEQHEILNNTIDCVPNQFLNPPIAIRSQRCTSCVMENNIVSNCGSVFRLVDNNDGTEIGYNDLFNNALIYDLIELGFGHLLVGHDLTSDPLYTQVFPRPDPFFRLQPLSPAIDAGNDAHCGATPDAGGCDMGAYQFVDNLPPLRPSITEVDEITGNSALLHGSPFADPDDGDTHKASQWQVDLVTGDFSNPVVDSGPRTNALTSFRARGLAAETTYKARVRYQDQDDAWSPWSDPSLDSAEEFTTLVGTAIAPEVVAVTPEAGSTDVPVTVTPALTFNTPVATASLTATSIRLVRVTKPSQTVASTLSLDGSETVVTITPTAFGSLLEPSTKYRISVLGGDNGVHSRDGDVPGKAFTSTFTTEGALASSNPATGATGVSTAVAPQLVFKWQVAAASVNTTIFKLKDATSGKNVPLASVVLAGDGVTVTLTPAAPIKANHKFVVIVKGGDNGLHFADGRRMGAAVKVKFRT
jgi:hypothetical protein